MLLQPDVVCARGFLTNGLAQSVDLRKATPSIGSMDMNIKESAVQYERRLDDRFPNLLSVGLGTTGV